jgi:flagellar basal body-associated protein FliL
MFWVLTHASIDQHLEVAHVSEQVADVAWQEKLLKLVSNELTKNTTRVVEMAIKLEVQNSVLPSPENITKVEVRAAFNGQITRGLGNSMNQVFLSRVSIFL